MIFPSKRQWSDVVSCHVPPSLYTAAAGAAASLLGSLIVTKPDTITTNVSNSDYSTYIQFTIIPAYSWTVSPNGYQVLPIRYYYLMQLKLAKTLHTLLHSCRTSILIVIKSFRNRIKCEYVNFEEILKRVFRRILLLLGSKTTMLAFSQKQRKQS